MSAKMMLVWLAIGGLMALIAFKVMMAKRSESALGLSKPVTEGVCLVAFPMLVGWLIGMTPFGNLATWLLSWVPYEGHLLAGAVPIIAVLWSRKESLDGEITVGDGLMVFPALFFGLVLFNSSLGVEIRTQFAAMQEAAEQHRVAVEKAQEEAKQKKVEEAKKPFPKLTEAEVKSVVWKGGKEVFFPIRTDGNWICEGNAVTKDNLKIGVCHCFLRSGKLVYESATDFPIGGPRIAFKKTDGVGTDEVFLKKTP